MATQHLAHKGWGSSRGGREKCVRLTTVVVRVDSDAFLLAFTRGLFKIDAVVCRVAELNVHSVGAVALLFEYFYGRLPQSESRLLNSESHVGIERHLLPALLPAPLFF